MSTLFMPAPCYDVGPRPTEISMPPNTPYIVYSLLLEAYCACSCLSYANRLETLSSSLHDSVSAAKPRHTQVQARSTCHFRMVPASHRHHVGVTHGSQVHVPALLPGACLLLFHHPPPCAPCSSYFFSCSCQQDCRYGCCFQSRCCYCGCSCWWRCWMLGSESASGDSAICAHGWGCVLCKRLGMHSGCGRCGAKHTPTHNTR